MADITDITDHEPSDPIKQFRTYLKNRAIPITNGYLEANGIEHAAANRMAEYLGFMPYSRGGVPPTGVLFKFPGSNYGTVKVLGEGGAALCPVGKPSHAYLANSIDWGAVSGELILCESVLKALTWVRYGYNALAAGGVDNIYQNGNKRWCEGFPHSALDSGAITSIRIAYDNDVRPEVNKDVARAVRTLAGALKARHPAVPVMVHELPDPPQEWQERTGTAKWGCDDAHAYHGGEWFAAFASNQQYSVSPDPDEMQEHLDYYNSTYVRCMNPVGAFHQRTGNFFRKADFIGTAEAHKIVYGGEKPAPTAPVWWIHPSAPTVHGTTYQPGQGLLVGEGEGARYNTWRASPVVPDRGDVTRWLDMLQDAIQCKVTLNLMLSCMAYQVQHRGTRLEKLLYFVGREVGTGKSTQINIMRRILGDSNTGPIDKGQLEGNFNDCWAAKELATLDDVEKLKRSTWSKIKTHITSETVLITKKNVDARSQENYTTFYISANQADILTTDADERRVLMIQFEPSVLHRENNDPYWTDFYRWLDKEGGAQHIAHYLGTYDLSDFDPHFYPPMSAIKQEAMESTRNEDEDFLIKLMESPCDYIPAGRVAVTNRELFIMMTGEDYHAARSSEMREMCKMIGARMYLKKAVPKQVRISGDVVTLYYVPGKGDESGKQFGNPKARISWLRENISKNTINLLQGD